MKKSIWKFDIPMTNTAEILAPKGAEWLHVDTQNGWPYIWARVDTEAAQVPHEFCVLGTGHPMSGEEGRHIGSFQMHDGALVYHVFERDTTGGKSDE